MVGLDDIISNGILEACTDHDSLMLLYNTVVKHGFQHNISTIFSPLKKAFIKYSCILDDLYEGKKQPELPALDFILDSVKTLDVMIKDNTIPTKNCHLYYRKIIMIIHEKADQLKEHNNIQFPLKSIKLEELFGKQSCGIWQTDCDPYNLAVLAFSLLRLEGTCCVPQSPLSQSQKTAIASFNKASSADGMSPQKIIKMLVDQFKIDWKSDRASEIFRDIEGDIVAHLMAPNIVEL